MIMAICLGREFSIKFAFRRGIRIFDWHGVMVVVLGPETTTTTYTTDIYLEMDEN